MERSLSKRAISRKRFFFQKIFSSMEIISSRLELFSTTGLAQSPTRRVILAPGLFLRIWAKEGEAIRRSPIAESLIISILFRIKLFNRVPYSPRAGFGVEFFSLLKAFLGQRGSQGRVRQNFKYFR